MLLRRHRNKEKQAVEIERAEEIKTKENLVGVEQEKTKAKPKAKPKTKPKKPVKR